MKSKGRMLELVAIRVLIMSSGKNSWGNNSLTMIDNLSRPKGMDR